MTTLRERFNRLLFQSRVRQVLDTPPVQAGRQAFTALSMVHHRDVLPYLLALKSFAAQAGPERVVVVADPTIDDADRALLRRHVPMIEIVPAQRFRRPALPVGGCWERLSAISTLNAEAGIVQVDADTLTTGPLDEVVDAMRVGKSFVLSSEAGIAITTLAEAAARGKLLAARSRHIQAVSEARFDELTDAHDLRYARGCAGFTGFGRGAIDTQRLEAVSQAMRALHGTRWDEWGSEQVTSNLLAASAPGAFMLPHPRYCNADSVSRETSLAHYIGYCRHVSRDYEVRGGGVIRALAAG